MIRTTRLLLFKFNAQDISSNKKAFKSAHEIMHGINAVEARGLSQHMQFICAVQES